MRVAPNFPRPGVIGGFALTMVAGLTPLLSIGALFAQGTLWLPTFAPTVPPAPANQYSYLAYNSTTGLYWTVNPNGTTAGDAVLGWVVTDGSDLLAVSGQDIELASSTVTSSGGSGGSGVLSTGGGEGSSGVFGGKETMTPDMSWNVRPDGSKGLVHYVTTTTNAIHFAPPINFAGGMMLCVVIKQGTPGRAVTWDAVYIGLAEYVVDTRAASYATLWFQVQEDLTCVCLMERNGVLFL